MQAQSGRADPKLIHGSDGSHLTFWTLWLRKVLASLCVRASYRRERGRSDARVHIVRSDLVFDLVLTDNPDLGCDTCDHIQNANLIF